MEQPVKMPFSKLIRDFVDNTDLSDNTRGLYLRVLNLYATWVVKSGRRIADLRRADIIAYKGSMKGRLSERTMENYLSVVRKFYSYCEEIGAYENIAAGIRVRIKDKSYKRAHLDQSEVKTVLESIDRNTLRGKRDFALINLLLRTGIRCIEASRLRVCDIRGVEGKRWLLLQRKGEMTRITRLGLSDIAINPVMEYLAFRGVQDPEESVFLTHSNWGEHVLTAARMSVIIRDRYKLSGIDCTMKSAHSLRHTAAVMAIKMKVPIKEVQVMLGHSSVKTTQLYLESFEDDLKLSNPAVHALDNAFG